MGAFFTKVFALTGQPRMVSQQEAWAAMQSVDRNGDGRANKM